MYLLAYGRYTTGQKQHSDWHTWALPKLPESKQAEASDLDDMAALFRAMILNPALRERMARDVERHTDTLPDLTDWKRAGAPEHRPG
jgi:hypothetical protein